jgi:hypothetical protein
MKKIYFVLFIFFSKLLIGQTPSSTATGSSSQVFVQEELNRALDPFGGHPITGFDSRYEGVKGSPFLNDSWGTGRLILSDSSIVKNNYSLRFNVYTNEIHIKLGEIERVLSNRELLSIELEYAFPSISSQKIKLDKIILPDNLNRHIFGIYLFEGSKFYLYKHIKKVFKKADFQDKGIATVGNNFDSFDEQIQYYLREKSNTPFKISLKKGDITSACKVSKGNQKKLDTFCKEKEISGKLTEAETIELMSFIETLKN